MDPIASDQQRAEYEQVCAIIKDWPMSHKIGLVTAVMMTNGIDPHKIAEHMQWVERQLTPEMRGMLYLSQLANSIGDLFHGK